MPSLWRPHHKTQESPQAGGRAGGSIFLFDNTSFASANYLIMSVTLLQKSHKSFQIFQMLEWSFTIDRYFNVRYIIKQ